MIISRMRWRMHGFFCMRFLFHLLLSSSLFCIYNTRSIINESHWAFVYNNIWFVECQLSCKNLHTKYKYDDPNVCEYFLFLYYFIFFLHCLCVVKYHAIYFDSKHQSAIFDWADKYNFCVVNGERLMHGYVFRLLFWYRFVLQFI